MSMAPQNHQSNQQPYVRLHAQTPDPWAEEQKAKFLRQWQEVKSARFNAAKRLERKHSASTMALVIAALIGFLSFPFELLFDQSLSTYHKQISQFTAYVTSVLSLSLGLIELAKDYPNRARRFDLCGKAVNSLVRHLKATPMRAMDDLKPYIERYEAALEKYEENHDDLDIGIAKAQYQTRYVGTDDEKRRAQQRLTILKTREWIEIYWIHASAWLLPLLVGFYFWHYVPAPEELSAAPQKAAIEQPSRANQPKPDLNPPTGSLSKSALERPFSRKTEEKQQDRMDWAPLNLPFTR